MSHDQQVQPPSDKLPRRELPAAFLRLRSALPLADLTVLFAIMVAVTAARFGATWPTYPTVGYLASFAATSVLLVGAYYLAGLYDLSPRLGAEPVGAKVLAASAAAVGTWAALQLAGTAVLDAGAQSRPLPMPLANLAAIITLGVPAIIGRHRLTQRLRNSWSGTPRLLLLGAAADAEAAADGLQGDPSVEVVATTEDPQETLALVHQHAVTDVLILDGIHLDRCYPQPLSTLEDAGVTVLRQLTTTHALLGIQRIREVGGLPFVLLRFQTLPRSRQRLKRLLDVTLLTAAAPLWLPLLTLAAAYVRMVAGSPALFRQRRVGHLGQPFTLVKFRTMVTDAEQHGPQLAGRDDDRVVAGCGWLRATRMDELPQLLNVARGEMSLVGPRPERPEITVQLEEDIPGYPRRHDLPPGLTGLAQVHGRYHTGARYKLGYDLQYLSSWTVWSDLSILVRTVWVVLTRRG